MFEPCFSRCGYYFCLLVIICSNTQTNKSTVFDNLMEVQSDQEVCKMCSEEPDCKLACSACRSVNYCRKVIPINYCSFNV
jgi:hypothetical protein